MFAGGAIHEEHGSGQIHRGCAQCQDTQREEDQSCRQARQSWRRRSAASTESKRTLSSRQILLQKFQEMKRKIGEGKVPLPSFWGGYRVEPIDVEFWQGRKNRLHDRFLYTRANKESTEWAIERLAP